MSTNNSWICKVCGYIHEGSEPPDVCPVCGVFKEEFAPYQESKAVKKEASGQWRCIICGYMHEGAQPPETCPLCGASADKFETDTAAKAIISRPKRKETYVIAGGGVAGVSAAEAIRSCRPDAEIKLFSKEEALPYYRINLTRYLAGQVAEKMLSLHPRQWYHEHGIEVQGGAELTTVDPEHKMLRLKNGEDVAYDKLVLTVGSHPFVPPFAGSHRDNVTPFRSRTDADFLIEQGTSSETCVVVGGGLLGLETAGGIARHGAKVTLLEGHDWLMPRQLNAKAGALLEENANLEGVHIRKNARVKEFVGDEHVRGVMLDDGTTLPAELVVIATGVRPNSYIARLAGLHVDRGIVVDDYLATSHPDIFAAGDVAEHRGELYGLWQPAQFMGKIAGLNAAGTRTEFGGIPRSHTLKILGTKMFSIGRITPEDGSYRAIDQEHDGTYSFFMFRDNQLVGAILLGDTRASTRIKKLVEGKTDCSKLLAANPGAADIINELLAG
ncbi:MAG: pyridine nucleotide-disulfide oxidoreductase [Chitinivibrionales bacterium]|nr:pyridine nucleotide-disulfide oxidoreductase [Chitinivibrionales bacterium]